jgi:hypothetical protein
MPMEKKRYISGVVWDVYLYILTSRESVGVREIWRNLKMSSPSLAQYHVNKLLNMDLISQTADGRYIAEELGRLKALRSFVLLRGKLISRMTFYGAFILGLLLVYIIFWPLKWDFRDFLVLILGIFSVFAFFFEALNQHRGLRTDVHRF